jgi:hypothetical protein
VVVSEPWLRPETFQSGPEVSVPNFSPAVERYHLPGLMAMLAQMIEPLDEAIDRRRSAARQNGASPANSIRRRASKATACCACSWSKPRKPQSVWILSFANSIVSRLSEICYVLLIHNSYSLFGNIYYIPYSGNSGWAGTGAFFRVTAPVGSTMCPKSATYSFTNWQNIFSSPKQDANSVAYNSSNTNPFKHPYCTDSTPDACLKDTTKQDDYSQATGFSIPTTFTFFNAGLAGRQGTTYPLCPTYASCPGTVIDTFPPTTFSLTSSGTNVLTSY